MQSVEILLYYYIDHNIKEGGGIHYTYYKHMKHEGEAKLRNTVQRHVIDEEDRVHDDDDVVEDTFVG